MVPLSGLAGGNRRPTPEGALTRRVVEMLAPHVIGEELPEGYGLGGGHSLCPPGVPMGLPPHLVSRWCLPWVGPEWRSRLESC